MKSSKWGLRTWVKASRSVAVVLATVSILWAGNSVQGQTKSLAAKYEMVGSPTAVKAEAELAKQGRPLVKIPTPAKEGAVTEGYKGDWDARLMNAVVGVDPVSLIPNALGLNSGAEKGYKFTPYSTIKNLPTMDEVRHGKPELICGNADERKRVTPTNSLPWQMNCFLVMTLADGSQATGTGWFVGPRAVMTAGHCIHDGGPGGQFITSCEIIPGSDGNKRPFGTYYSSKFYTVRGWTNDAAPDYDYGVIILSSDVGNRLGYYGYANYSTTQLTGMLANTAGYPGDKPSGTQWRTSGYLPRPSERIVYTSMDVYPGQSGSSIYRNSGSSRISVAVFAYSACPTANNFGTRINSFVYNNITSWKTLK